jgi:PhnB protein
MKVRDMTSTKISPVPKGYRTVTPHLVVRGADAAAAHYEAVFGATVLSRVVAEDGFTVLQAELKIGNSIVRLMDEMPAFGVLSPLSLGGTPAGLHLYLRNVDEVWEKALAQGAGVLIALADMPWGERFAKFVDPFGHVWSVARRIEVPAAAPEPAVRKTDSFSVHEPRADYLDPTLEQVVARQAAAKVA